MNILANENLYEPMIEFLRSERHNVISVRDCGLSGALDEISRIIGQQKPVRP